LREQSNNAQLADIKARDSEQARIEGRTETDNDDDLLMKRNILFMRITMNSFPSLKKFVLMTFCLCLKCL